MRRTTPLLEKKALLPLLLLLLGLTLRLVYIWEIGDSMLFDVLLTDSHTYDQFALKIMDGTFQGEEVYSMNILYPYFLAGIYAILGRNWIAVAVVQAFIDIASCLLVYLIGLATFGRKTALIALLLSSVYGIFIFYSGALLTPTLINLLLLAMLYLLVRYAYTGNVWLLLASGFLCGMASLGRGNAVLLIPLYLVASRLLEKKWKTALSRWGLFAIGGLAVIFAVTVRNYTVEKEFVPISGNYAAFYIGNNETSNGLYSRPPFIAGASFEDEVLATREAVSKDLGRDVTLGEAASYLFRSGIEYVVENPIRVLRLDLLKAFYFFNSTEPPTNLNYHFAREFSGILRALPMDFGIIASLGILGLILSLTDWRKLAFFYLYAGAFFITCIVFFVSAEYRMPAVPVFILFASVAVLWIYRVLRRLLVWTTKRPRQAKDAGPGPCRETSRVRCLWPFILLAVLLVATHVQTDLLKIQTMTRLDHLNFASLYHNRGDYAKAIELAKQSLELDPHYGLAHAKLYQLYNIVGKHRLSYYHLEESLKYRPVPETDDGEVEADTKVRRASAAYLAGEYQKALVLFQALLPETVFVETHRILNNIGLCYAMLQDPVRAEAAYKQAIALEPAYSKAYNNLADLYRSTGDYDRAALNYAKAIELEPQFTKARMGFARMYDMVGDRAEARNQLEQILTYDPQNAQVKQLLQYLAD